MSINAELCKPECFVLMKSGMSKPRPAVMMCFMFNGGEGEFQPKLCSVWEKSLFVKFISSKNVESAFLLIINDVLYMKASLWYTRLDCVYRHDTMRSITHCEALTYYCGSSAPHVSCCFFTFGGVNSKTTIQGREMNSGLPCCLMDVTMWWKCIWMMVINLGIQPLRNALQKQKLHKCCILLKLQDVGCAYTSCYANDSGKL